MFGKKQDSSSKVDCQSATSVSQLPRGVFTCNIAWPFSPGYLLQMHTGSYNEWRKC